MNDSLDALPGHRALDEGTVFAGRFRVVRALGQGGMGSVYEAVQVTLDRPVALKLLHPALTMDLALVQRFQREAKLMASLRHPHIVEVIDAGVEDGALWIAMEYLRGETLAHWLESLEHPPAPSELLPRVAPIARALAHMHAREIVHRDVKPDNVMLARGEEGEVTPKLLDLGIAHPRAQGAKLTATGTLLGTPAYIAPEQAWGVADISPAADQWSFAAMLYEAFTGHLPHEADTPMGIITRRVAGPAEIGEHGVRGALALQLGHIRPADAAGRVEIVIGLFSAPQGRLDVHPQTLAQIRLHAELAGEHFKWIGVGR